MHLLGAVFFGAEAQTDRQTDMTKLIDAFGNFANATKNYALRRFLQGGR